MNNFITIVVQLSLLFILSISIQGCLDSDYGNASHNIKKISKDVNRFIAHAGGQINGNRDTNSLEALNLNYKLGFRLFELDIIKTSDNIYVASHDWESWEGYTEYKGNLPPTRKNFKKHKILRKYTPLDMSDINKWFEGHPDAILVTDKVNNPFDFSNKFIDRSRLMMELFSLEAVDEGVKANIKAAMPNLGLVAEMTGDKVKKLKAMGVTAITADRLMLSNQKNLLNSLNKVGVKVFVFNLNFEKGKDEIYVICNEMDYFYGIYADKWNFNSELDCRTTTIIP